jgi:hypothetical protein
MSQLNTNIIKGVQDNDDVVIKTNNTTRITIASGGDVSLPTTTCTTLSAPSVSAVNTCKAWARWDGTGGGHAEVAGATFNVSSIAYNGTGNYTVNLTIPLAFGSGGCVVGSAGDSNYSSADTNLNFRHDVSSNSTIDVIIATDGGADHSDCDQISMAVFN